jgi:hypothetical protein
VRVRIGFTSTPRFHWYHSRTLYLIATTSATIRAGGRHGRLSAGHSGPIENK